MGEMILHVCNFEASGGETLEALMLDKTATAPLPPEVDRNDLLAVTVWYKVTHGEPIQTPTRAAHAISALSLNYSRVRKKSGIIRHGWVRPREDFVKLIIDVDFCADTCSGSTGAIIRDDSWRLIAASCCGIYSFYF
jgi:hypothetical protein